ncbi:hypothetical protein PDO_5343, partial [Rhizobium sp. PDO1-076]
MVRWRHFAAKFPQPPQSGGSGALRQGPRIKKSGLDDLPIGKARRGLANVHTVKHDMVASADPAVEV